MDKGAHYYRTDLQVHTPRDSRWSGTHYVSDEDRNEYAVRFIRACREKGLDAVAITDHHDLGRVSTWTKWATPTAEALRQACLAQESRVSQEEPRLPAVVITSISLTNSKFLGPFDLKFNPQYSALIGGRGTGKSTILEYLRSALCDQPPPGMEDDDIPNYLGRRKRLIDQTLRPVDATAEVQFEVNGVPHTVRRESRMAIS